MAKRKFQATSLALLVLSIVAGSTQALAGCKHFREYLPPEVGGGCVEFEICCYAGHCEVYNIIDMPLC